MAFRPVQPQDCLPRFLPAAGPLCLPGLCPAGVKEHYCCQPGDNRRHGSGFAEHFRGPSNLRSRALRHSTQAIPDGSRQGAWFHSLSGTAPMVASKLLTTFSSWTPLAVYCCLMASIGLNDILRS